jgi:hypothetical protein
MEGDGREAKENDGKGGKRLEEGTRRMCWNGVTWDKRDGFDMERGRIG